MIYLSALDNRTPVPGIRDLAHDYALDYRRSAFAPGGDLASPAPYLRVPMQEARAVADLFDAAPLSAPATPALAASYRAMCEELLAQWTHLVRFGYRFQPWQGEGQPYADSTAMFEDLVRNRRLLFFPTQSGFGENAEDVAPNHPLLRPSPVYGMVWNDLLRAVHDVFGHAIAGNTFGPLGEFNAWIEHARLFSPAARLALACETKAQNFWVNFGPHLRRPDGSLPVYGDPDWIPLPLRRFAAQKLVELPAWAVHPPLSKLAAAHPTPFSGV